MQNRMGWGFRLYTTCHIAITLGGFGPRALVVDNQIQIRHCLDIGFNFDHRTLDGAAATRFIADLMASLESGRALSEYQSAH